MIRNNYNQTLGLISFLLDLPTVYTIGPPTAFSSWRHCLVVVESIHIGGSGILKLSCKHIESSIYKEFNVGWF